MIQPLHSTLIAEAFSRCYLTVLFLCFFFQTHRRVVYHYIKKKRARAETTYTTLHMTLFMLHQHSLEIERIDMS
jgi:hypothetical protein